LKETASFVRLVGTPTQAVSFLINVSLKMTEDRTQRLPVQLVDL
jgi:hypothetical protein